MLIRRIFFAFCFSLLCVSESDGAQKVHKFKGVVEEKGSTFTGSVTLDWKRWSKSNPPKVNILTSWGAVCTGYFHETSELHDSPFGAFACSDGSVGRFTWGSFCAEHFLVGNGTVESREIFGETRTSKFNFKEDWPSSCSCCSKSK
jgi:hypothetical protein